MLTEKKQQGFTIIEVVIVLVIAAIIMLMVFLVVPYLQRTQRDSRRQNDARRLVTALEQYNSNNGGQYPADGVAKIQGVIYDDPTAKTKTASYIKETFSQPNGSAYTIAWGTTATGKADSTTQIIINPNGTCTAGTVSSGNGGLVASVYQENGSAVCIP